MKKLSTIGLALIACLTCSAGVLPAYAENGASSDNASINHVRTVSATESSMSTDTTGDTSGSAPTDAEARKAEAKAKQCARRQTVVNKITAHIAERGQKQLDLFTTIASRVEAFYTKSGKTLSNYDQLVTAVGTAQTNAQQAVDTIKSTTITLKCDGTDPNGAGASFKAALKSEIQALKDLRTAVKNLTVGVKSVQGTTSSGDNSSAGGQQ